MPLSGIVPPAPERGRAGPAKAFTDIALIIEKKSARQKKNRQQFPAAARITSAGSAANDGKPTAAESRNAFWKQSGGHFPAE